jgi:hypothetical protein
MSSSAVVLVGGAGQLGRLIAAALRDTDTTLRVASRREGTPVAELVLEHDRNVVVNLIRPDDAGTLNAATHVLAERVAAARGAGRRVAVVNVGSVTERSRWPQVDAYTRHKIAQREFWRTACDVHVVFGLPYPGSDRFAADLRRFAQLVADWPSLGGSFALSCVRADALGRAIAELATGLLRADAASAPVEVAIVDEDLTLGELARRCGVNVGRTSAIASEPEAAALLEAASALEGSGDLRTARMLRLAAWSRTPEQQRAFNHYRLVCEPPCQRIVVASRHVAPRSRLRARAPWRRRDREQGVGARAGVGTRRRASRHGRARAGPRRERDDRGHVRQRASRAHRPARRGRRSSAR